MLLSFDLELIEPMAISLWLHHQHDQCCQQVVLDFQKIPSLFSLSSAAERIRLQAIFTENQANILDLNQQGPYFRYLVTNR
jgi:hypothetical protein